MSQHLSLALLESALCGHLSGDDEVGLQHHLDECEECCAAMERLAGGPSLFTEAAALLATDELDGQLGESLTARDAWSDIDFTVEHLEPSDEPNVLGRLGGYDIQGIIGRGGNGIVLKGYDRELKRCVAIKVLAPHLAQSSLAKKRFAREAQAAAAVVHPHVVAIHQVQPNGRLPFLVMPLVAGESLAQRLAAQGSLELKETLRIGMQAAAGLAAAHEQGLVHRDVKPANILLEKGVERAVLTDFGLARAADDVTFTYGGNIAGTPQYMSPEQARGEALDCRSDLFSLGCVLYEMSTGVSPFRTDTPMATLRRLIDDSPQAMASINPELPPWFVAIVNRLLEKSPDKRFSSAKEVSELLEGCLAHVQQPASVPLPVGLPKWKPVRKSAWGNSRVIGLLAVLATFGIAALGAAFLEVSDPPDIAGQWQGTEWGTVTLTPASNVEYTGTYTDTFGKGPGELHLRWSRIERRFNGIWREGEDRFGEISLRLVGDEIRGANTTDAKSKINPATPRLADFAWKRVGTSTASGQSAKFGPLVERTIPYTSAIDFVSGRVMEWPEKWRNMNLKGVNRDEQKWIVDAGVAATAYGDGLMGHGTVAIAWKGKFDEATADQVLQATAPLTLEKNGLQPDKNVKVLVFRTREGTSGILEIVDFGNKTTGLKLRYKLAQAAVAATAKLDKVGETKFGGVVERLIPENKAPTYFWFDFETGQVISGADFDRGHEVDDIEDEVYQQWRIKNGIDVGARFEKDSPPGLVSLDPEFTAMAVKDEQWDKMTPALISTMIRASLPSDRSNVMAVPDKFPATFIFKTREGGRGILQIRSVNKGGASSSIGIRYKLAKGQLSVSEPKEPKIELIAVERFTTHGVELWKPDGGMLSDKIKQALVDGKRNRDARLPLAYWFLITGATDFSQWSGSFGNSPSMHMGAYSEQLGGQIVQIEVEYSDKDSTDISFGLPNKPLRPLVTWNAPEMVVERHDPQFAKDVPAITMKSALQTNGVPRSQKKDRLVTQVTIRLPKGMRYAWDWKLEIIDDQGKSHQVNDAFLSPPTGDDPNAASDGELLAYEAAVAKEDVKKIVLSGRSHEKDYSSKEFKGVRLKQVPSFPENSTEYAGRPITAAGKLDATAGEPTKWLCRANLDVADVGAISEGQQATVTVSALANRTFHGKVKSVAQTDVVIELINRYPSESAPNFKVGLEATVTFAWQPRSSSIDAAQREVYVAELQKAQADLNRLEQLFKSNTVSAEDRDNAKDAVAKCEAQLTGDVVRVAQVELQAAKRKFDRIGSLYQDKSVSTEVYENAKHDVAIAVAKLRWAEEQQAKDKTGKGSATSQSTRTMTAAGTLDATTGEPAKWVARVIVNPADADGIHAGQDALVTVNALLDRAFRGKVKSVDKTDAVIELLDSDPKFVVGLTVSVTFDVPRTSSSIDTAQRDVYIAELKKAQAELNRLEELFKSGAVSTEARDNARDAVAKCEAQMTGDITKMAKVDLQTAKRKFDRLNALFQNKSISAEEFENAKHDVAIAEAKLRLAEEQRARDKIGQGGSTSQMTKLITGAGKLDTTTGEPAKWVCHVRLAEGDSLLDRLSQEVEFTLDAIAGRTFRGKVTQVGVSEAWIELIDTSPSFKVGLITGVTINPPRTSSSIDTAQRELYVAELRKAQAELNRLEQQFKSGAASVEDRDNAKDAVAKCEAQLTGDVAKMAEVDVQAAKRKFDQIAAKYPASSQKYESAKSDLAIAEAKLRLAQNQRQLEGYVRSSQASQAQAEADLAERKVVEAQLQQAKETLKLADARFQTGLTDPLEYEVAKAKVAVLEARLTGNEADVAEAKLAAARNKVIIAKDRFDAGQINGIELDKYKSAQAAAEDELRAAHVKVMTTNRDKVRIGEDTDLTDIRGDWQVVSVYGEATFRWQQVKLGDRIRISNTSLQPGAPQDASRDYYVLAPMASPKAFDVTFWVENLFQTQNGIYRLDGSSLNQLTLCVAKRGEKRPTKFLDESGNTVIVLTRVTATESSQKVEFGPDIEGIVRNRSAFNFGSQKAVTLPDADKNPEKGLLWVLEQGLASITDWMTKQNMDAISDGTSLTSFGMQVRRLDTADFSKLAPAEVEAKLNGDWKDDNLNPATRLVQAIDPVDPKAARHFILAPQKVFVFKTRDGRIGILQGLSSTADGLKIRYKLIVKKSTEPQFGAVVERTLSDPTESRKTSAIHFDTGELLPLPSLISLKTREDTSTQRDALKWARTNHVDAVVSLTTSSDKKIHRILLGPDLLTLPVANEHWDKMTAADLEKELKRAISEWRFIPEVSEMTVDGTFPATFLFQTRTNRLGILQITGATEKPSGVKLRYKLIATASDKVSQREPWMDAKLSEKSQKAVEAMMGNIEQVQVILEHQPQDAADRHSLLLTAGDAAKSPEFYLRPSISSEQLLKLIMQLAADGYFDRATGGAVAEKASQSPPQVKNPPGYALIVNCPASRNTPKHVYLEDLSGRNVAALAVAKMLCAGLDDKVAAEKLVAEVEAGVPKTAAAFSASKQQIAQIDTLLKDAPVTTRYLAELFERTPGVEGEYRFRSDVTTIPIMRAEKTALDVVPYGQILFTTGSTSFYIQRDDLGSSSMHYYGPFSFYNPGVIKTGLPGAVKSSAAATSSSPRIVFQIQMKDSVEPLVFSPNGKVLATGGESEFVLLADASGKELLRLELFDKQERDIVRAAQDAEGGAAKTRRSRRADEAINGISVRALAFSADGNTLAAGDDLGRVKLLDAQTGKVKLSLDDVNRNPKDHKDLPKILQMRIAQGPIWALAFSPDGSLLVTCGEAMDYHQDRMERETLRGESVGLIKLWDAKTGELKLNLDGQHSSQVMDIAFSPDGKLIATAGNFVDGSGVRLWDTKTGKVVKTFSVPGANLGGGTANCLSFSPDGKRLAMGVIHYDKTTDINSGSISVYYVASGILDVNWRVTHAFRPVRWTPDGKEILTLDGDQRLVWWDAATGKQISELKATGNGKQHWRYFAISPDGSRVAVGGADEHRGLGEVYLLADRPNSDAKAEPAVKPQHYIGAIGPTEAAAPEVQTGGKPRKVIVVFSIPEADVQAVFAALKTKQPPKVDVRLGGAKAEFVGSGTLVSTSDKMDSRNDTLSCKAIVDTSGDLAVLPGMFVNIDMSIEATADEGSETKSDTTEKIDKPAVQPPIKMQPFPPAALKRAEAAQVDLSFYDKQNDAKYHRLTLYVPIGPFTGPGSDPWDVVGIPAEQMAHVLDYLAGKHFFETAITSDELEVGKWQPCYVLRVRQDGRDYYTNLGWNHQTAAWLEDFAKQLDGEAIKGLGKLLDALKPKLKEWETASWGEATNGLRLRIEPQRSIYSVGDNVILNFQFKNETDKPIVVLDARAFNRATFHQFTFKFDDGKEIADTVMPETLNLNLEKGLGEILVRNEVPPHSVVERQVSLSSWNLAGLGHPYTSSGKEPRSFVVTGSYRTPVGLDLKDPTVAMGQITAKPIRVEIVAEHPPISNASRAGDSSAEAIAAAKKRAEKQAAADIAAGRIRILYAGKPWSGDKPLVDDATGIRVVIAAGCAETAQGVAELEAYNAAVRDWHSKQQTAAADKPAPEPQNKDAQKSDGNKTSNTKASLDEDAGLKTLRTELMSLEKTLQDKQLTVENIRKSIEDDFRAHRLADSLQNEIKVLESEIQTQLERIDTVANKAADADPSKAAAPVFEMRLAWNEKGDDREQMGFHEVNTDASGKQSRQTLYVEKTASIDCRDIAAAEVKVDTAAGASHIDLRFTKDGTKKLAELTREKGRRLAIIIGGEIYSAPQIQSQIIQGQAQITGNFSEHEAKDLAEAINKSIKKP